MDEVGGDWLASLARQCTSAERKSSSNPSGSVGSVNNNNSNNNNFLTKAQRIERRDLKRSQREERKRSAEEARQQHIARKRQKTKHVPEIVRAKSSTEGGNGTTPKSRGVITSTTKQALSRLSASLKSTLSSHHVHQKTNLSFLPTIRQKKDKNKSSPSTSSSPPNIINGLPAELSGKATKRSTLRPDSKELQPRIRDYNGQGLVRPSLYLPFNDPSFVPKLEMEFHEHVPGFFGKAKKKASKKDEDMMLWKKCLKAKVMEAGEGGGAKDRVKRGNR